jgi:hypothetical protein
MQIQTLKMISPALYSSHDHDLDLAHTSIRGLKKTSDRLGSQQDLHVFRTSLTKIGKELP